MTIYYVARSDAGPDEVCSALRAAHFLPAFEFDAHDNWRYARSGDGRIHLNVTQASDDRTIETWIAGCPAGVNYQIILTSEAEPPGFVPSLTEILDCEVVGYARSGADEVA